MLENNLSELPELPDAPKETLFGFIRRAYRSNRISVRVGFWIVLIVLIGIATMAFLF